MLRRDVVYSAVLGMLRTYNFEIELEGCIRRAFAVRPVRAELSNYQENTCRFTKRP